MPSSVMVGSRPPRSCLIFSYSSSVRPCCRIVSGEKAEVKEVGMEELYCRILGCNRYRVLRREEGPFSRHPATILEDEIDHRRYCGTYRSREDGAGKSVDRY